MRKTIAVDLSMFVGKTRECISKAVQQRMFGWGYAWCKIDTTEQYINKPYLYMATDNTITYSDTIIPHRWRSYEYIGYTAEEFLSLTEDPLKAGMFEVGKPYTDNERVVICTESVDAPIFKGVPIFNVHPWIHEELWREEEYSKSMFIPLDPSRIKIEVLPCK
jgi:hypothetical protein